MNGAFARRAFLTFVTAAFGSVVLSKAVAAQSPQQKDKTTILKQRRQPMTERSALVLIEFQREWLDEDGKIRHLMQDQEQFQLAIAGAKQALEAARRSHIQVIHCGLKFQPGHPELGKAQYGLREAIARFGTFSADGKGSQFVEPFVPQDKEFVVQGRTGGSGFAGSNLDSYLKNQGITKLYLAGFALHVCIESTLRQGHDLGYTVIVLEDACAAFNQPQRQHVLEDVVHHFGHRMTVDQFITETSSINLPRSRS